MRSAMLSLLVLLSGAVSLAQADYFRFIYVPAVAKDRKNPAQGGGVPGEVPGGVPGVPPGEPGGGVPGVPPGGPGIPGAPPGGGIPGVPGQPAEGAPPANEEIDWAYARHIVVEVKKVTPKTGAGLQWLELEHKWGKTLLLPPNTNEFRYVYVEENKKGLPTVGERYGTKRNKLIKDKESRTPEKLLEMAEFALAHGLTKKFQEEMAELKELQPKSAEAKAYDKFLTDSKRAAKKSEAEELWKERLGEKFKIKTSDHYALLYDGNESPEVDKRLKQLEDHYRSFFFWFALKGKPLPLPDRRLVVVLVDKPDDFMALRQAFDVPDLAADGFYSRRDNIAVISSDSLDEAFEGLNKSARDLWVNEGWNKESLLKGEWKRGESLAKVAHAQQTALLLKIMQEESERATVSHVGSQQLTAAVGLLPPAVAVPEWISFGIGSFYETPKGAYWPGTGAPHWQYLAHFKLAREDKKLDKAVEELKKVVSDGYFREAKAGQDPEALVKAQMMAWSLTYFLAQNQSDGLIRYFQELSNLPRDMELSEEVYLGCFVRALGVADSANPNQPNEVRFRELASKWYNYIDGTQLEVSEVRHLVKQQEEHRRKARTNPAPEIGGQPPAPGGTPPGGMPPGDPPPGGMPPSGPPPGGMPPGGAPPGGMPPSGPPPGGAPPHQH